MFLGIDDAEDSGSGAIGPVAQPASNAAKSPAASQFSPSHVIHFVDCIFMVLGKQHLGGAASRAFAEKTAF
jgi:hypothetical protein